MTKSKKTKRALLSSAMALLLCFTMLLGTTFAWFTDSATSGRNTIQSGNLDMTVSYKPYGAENTEWTEIDSATDIFGKDAKYEPGYTEAVWIKVENEGSLAFRYQMTLDVKSETAGKTKDNEDINLSEHLVVSSTPSTDIAGFESFFTTRESLASSALKEAGKLTDGSIVLANNGVVFPNTDTAASAPLYYLVVINMPTTVGNEANHNGTNIPKIDFGITALATQVPYEKDSFGIDYDANAEYVNEDAMKIIPAPADAVSVSTFDELKAAVATGGNIKLANGIGVSEVLDVTGEAAIYGEGNSLVLADGYTGTLANVSGNLSLYSVAVDGQVDWIKINTPSVQNPTVISTTAEDYYAVNNGVASTENVFTVTGTLSLVSSEIKNFIAPNVISVSQGTVNLDDALVEKNVGRIITTGQNATVNVNDGTVIQDNLAVKINGGLVNIAASTININKGASFNNNLGINSDLFYSPNASSGTLNINGGKLNSNEVYSTNNGYALIYMDTTLKVIVDNGGEITNNVGGAEAIVSTRRNRDRMELNSGKITGNVSTTGGYILSIRATQIGADMVIDGKVYVRLGSTDAEHYFTNAGVINGDVTVSQLNTLFVNTGTINGNLAMIDGSLGCDNQGTITGTVTP